MYAMTQAYNMCRTSEVPPGFLGESPTFQLVIVAVWSTISVVFAVMLIILALRPAISQSVSESSYPNAGPGN
jgi:hypothetical protein